jgi:hypothetical protein
MSAADWVSRWSTTLAVPGVMLVAAVLSYVHASDFTSWPGRQSQCQTLQTQTEKVTKAVLSVRHRQFRR